MSRGSQRYVIDGLSEKSSVVPEPWERLLDILALAGARCEWQGDMGQRYIIMYKTTKTYYNILQILPDVCWKVANMSGYIMSL